MNKSNIFIIYDSILNSVFECQVLEPIKKLAVKNPNEKFIIISYERDPEKIFSLKLALCNNISIKIIKRYRFLGKITLLHSLIKIQKILKDMTIGSLHVTARGPFAGFIALKSEKYFKSITIQIRGLAQEEFDYENYTNNLIKKLINRFRSWQFYTLEKYVYSMRKRMINYQSVSQALKDYINKKYKTPYELISISNQDIPEIIDLDLKKTYKKEIRKLLNIEDNKAVYCYNGSAKKWQCPKETLEFFKDINQKEKNTFLLILTNECNTFEKLANSINLQNYKILRVNANDVTKYLCACNYGIILRQPHILNWVSRPTKALEYKAAGLKVIHNNTIEYLL